MSSGDPYDHLVFPENLPPIKRTQSVQIPPALNFITKLLYRSGTGLSLVYLILIVVIQPLLETAYDRRVEFNSFVLKRAISLLKFISQRQRIPTVAVKINNKLYSDAQIQTEGSDEVVEREQTKSTVLFKLDNEEQIERKDQNIINDKLSTLKTTLEDYNKYCVPIDEIHPFSFQIKKLQGKIDAYNHAQLFSVGRQMAGHSSGVEIRNEIRTIKGWYLSGKV